MSDVSQFQRFSFHIQHKKAGSGLLICKIASLAPAIATFHPFSPVFTSFHPFSSVFTMFHDHSAPFHLHLLVPLRPPRRRWRPRNRPARNPCDVADSPPAPTSSTMPRRICCRRTARSVGDGSRGSRSRSQCLGGGNGGGMVDG